MDGDPARRWGIIVLAPAAGCRLAPNPLVTRLAEAGRAVAGVVEVTVIGNSDELRPAIDRLPACEFVLLAAPADADWPGLPRLIEAAEAAGAASRGELVTDTVKLANAAGFVAATPDRARLRRLVTPQALRRDWLESVLAAGQPAVAEAAEAAAAVAAGHQVVVVDGG